MVDRAVGTVVGQVRLWLCAEGAAVLVVSLLGYWHLGRSWWWFAALLLAPDLSMIGYTAGARLGAACYNAAHSYVLPLAMAAIATLAHSGRPAPYLCIWLAHIGMDRAMGYGLKYPTGFKETHLGTLGGVARGQV